MIVAHDIALGWHFLPVPHARHHHAFRFALLSTGIASTTGTWHVGLPPGFSSILTEDE
jgi:hypothetical protein